jgi:hemoglobin-like flavoprotein
MKVQELLNNIHNQGFNMDEFVEVKKYLPIEFKKNIAQGILYECVDEVNGIQKIDSVQKYLSYVKYMIVTHTSLEYTDEDYDILCSTEYNGTNLLNAILDCFGNDAKECEMVLNFMVDDYSKEISLEFSIAKFLNGLNVAIAKLADKFNDVNVKEFIPDSVDMDKLGTFLNNYIK